MLAAVLHAPPTLRIQRYPIPTPSKPTDVLIRVRAFGLNRSELYTRQGLSGPAVPLPRILGIEAVGTLESIPDPNPTGMRKGDAVVTIMGGMGRVTDGGYAEYTCVSAENVWVVDRALVPSALSEASSKHFWTTLGALPETYQTAWGSLVKVMQTTSQDTLLIRGGTTTIGLAAAAIAKHKLGCKLVVATTRSETKAEEVKKTGNVDGVLIEPAPTGKLADTVAAQYPEKFSRVLDLTGCSTLRDSLKCTSFGGVACLTGFAGGIFTFEADNPDGLGVFSPTTDIPIGSKLTFFGSNAQNLREMPFDEYLKDALEGTVTIPVVSFEGLEKVVEAHELMERSGVAGKMVVLVP